MNDILHLGNEENERIKRLIEMQDVAAKFGDNKGYDEIYRELKRSLLYTRSNSRQAAAFYFVLSMTLKGFYYALITGAHCRGQRRKSK